MVNKQGREELASTRAKAGWLRLIAPYVGVVVGIVVLASPVLADLVESWRAQGTISQATTAVDQVDAATKDRLLAQAHAYNRQLVTHESADDVLPYKEQLSLGDTGVMCWVQIPRIDVRLGVYHGTSEEALAAGAGHIEGTSLPVGGASTHCVISAHSGMPTARMFDDIHDLAEGDLFVVWTLGEPLAYRVVQSAVVEPDETEGIAIEPGRDLCTLITCTPYGVNSQRLLVRGERCPYEEDAREDSPFMYISPRIWPLVAGLVAAGAVLAVVSLRVLRAQRKGGERP